MGAVDLLGNLAAIGVIVAVHGGNLIVRPWSLVSDEARQALKAAKPEVIGLLTPIPARPYRLTPEQLDMAHAYSWDDATIARFQAREDHMRRLEFNEHDAEDLAMRLQLRDVHADHRHLCIECRNYRPGRCSHHRAADLHSPVVSHEWATMFQDCPGFSPCVALSAVPARGPTQ
jgi:hypothetical protein